LSSILPTVKEPVADGQGRIGAAWYRLFARFERLINGAVTTPGTGLTTTGSGALTIAQGGVTNEMLEDGLACSVTGRPLNSVGPRQNIVAGGNEMVLQRIGDEVLFGYLQLAGFTVATVPRAGNYPQGMVYISDESGGAVVAFSDGVDWRRVTDRAIIS
jgi:hypothetical protein